MTSGRERALREREREYECLLSMMHLAPVGLGRLDAAGRFDVVNPELSRLMQAAAPGADLGNFFDFLAALAPDLAEKALAHEAPDGRVLEDARIAGAGAIEGLSCSLTRAHRGAYFVALREVASPSRIADEARLTTGPLELESEVFELKRLVGEAIDLIRAAAQAKGLAVTEEFDRIGAGAFRGDAGRLRQILAAFLSNAVKFTQSGGVKLKVRGMPEPGGRWRLRLEVRDSGIGVSDAAKRRLFQPLGGAGLGLSLARGLAGAMGGACGVADRPGGGSIFWVEVVLPVAASETAAPARAVLVVDDGKVNAEIVRLVLSAAGFEVQVAGDGAAAVEAARARDFALILMDIHMPRMDGFAATRAIRALPGAAARVPVIGMSANAMPETEARGREAGMNDYVVKPLAPTKLRALARRWARADVA